MWKALWQTWTIDKPAMLGDWLWDVFVVQFAAFLDRLTLRQIAVYIPLVILFLAYAHDIPVSPALIFLGDLLAYIDIFAVLVLLGILSRVATVVFVVRQTAARVAELASSVMMQARRLDVRHRRERGGRGRKRIFGRRGNDDDESGLVGGFAWA
jgi:hypothetical protein